MLRELLLRDLILHRRVFLAAAVYPLLLAAFLGLAPGAKVESLAVLFLGFGLILVALLPLSLQVREGMLATLGDLLALPVRRRDIIRLRYLEGALACLGLWMLSALSWVLFHRAFPKDLLPVLRSPALLWILLIFLAYPLPFYVRWKGKGLVLAYGALLGGLYCFAYAVLAPHESPLRAQVFGWMGRLYHAWGTYSENLVDYGVPLLLLTLCYAASVRALERTDA